MVEAAAYGDGKVEEMKQAAARKPSPEADGCVLGIPETAGSVVHLSNLICSMGPYSLL